MPRSLAALVLVELQLQLPNQSVQLSLKSGDRIRLSGANGSGKTTILRALAGLSTPFAAQVTLDGDDPREMSAQELAKRVAYVPHSATDGLVGLTVAGESRLRGKPGIGNQPIASLSSGQARKLALGLAEAPLLLLDEPTEGLDQAGIQRLTKKIEQHSGIVVFSDHGPLANIEARTINLGLGEPGKACALPRAGTNDRLFLPAHTAHGIQFPALRLPNGVHVVTGANGSGKSTWLRLISGLDTVSARIDGTPAKPGQNVTLLFPEARDHLYQTEVAPDSKWSPGVGGRHPWTLSAGEGQRAALAGILRLDVPLILLDEPESHLDTAGRTLLYETLAELGDSKCILVATHDAELIAAATSVVRLP